MPRQLRLPELPRGQRADFVNTVRYVFREAGRPRLQDVSDRITVLTDKRERDAAAGIEGAQIITGTASKETIRQLLLGKTVPKWPQVHAIFEALCDMGGVDPNQSQGWNEDRTLAEQLKDEWNAAWDEPVRAPASGMDDPWAPVSDAPPF